MKLIDANPIIEKYTNYEYFFGYEDFDNGIEAGVLSIVDELENASEIDPVHFAGGCYCRECFHSELEEHEYVDDWKFKREWWCNKHKDTMPLNGFCSEGRIANYDEFCDENNKSIGEVIGNIFDNPELLEVK